MKKTTAAAAMARKASPPTEEPVATATVCALEAARPAAILASSAWSQPTDRDAVTLGDVVATDDAVEDELGSRDRVTLALPECVPGSEGGGVARPVMLAEALPVGDTVAEVEALSVGTLEGGVLGRDARVRLDVAVDEALRDARGSADDVATPVAGAVAE
jgi:hypothetical protein